MNLNAIQLKPINKGEIAVAMQQLNELTETTEFIAVDIPKKLPRLMIKNVQLDYLPENLTAKLAQKYPLIYDLLSSEDTIETFKVVTILKNVCRNNSSIIIETTPNIRKMSMNEGKVKLGMRVYEIVDPLSVAQCNKCNKCGHIAKYCRAENETCGMCSASHSSKACAHYNERFLTTNDRKTNMKNGSNCSNHRKYQHNAFSRGSMGKK